MTLPSIAMSQHKRMASGDKNIGFKSGGAVKDVETKAEMKRYGKEGSKSEEAHDKKEMAWGGRVPRVARPVQSPMVSPQAARQMPPGMGMKRGGKAGKK